MIDFILCYLVVFVLWKLFFVEMILIIEISVSGSYVYIYACWGFCADFVMNKFIFG